MTSNKEKITEKNLGMKAIKKQGFFSGLIGIIVRSESQITDFAIEFSSGSRVGIRYVDDVKLLDI